MAKVATVVRVQSLAQGLPQAVSVAKKKKKKRIMFSEWNLWKDTYNEYLLNNSKFPGVSAGSGSGIVTMAAEVAPVAWVHSLSQELPHAVGGAKKN